MSELRVQSFALRQRYSVSYIESSREMLKTQLPHVCTKPGYSNTLAIKYFTVVRNIFVSSVWNLLNVILLEPRILTWLLDY